MSRRGETDSDLRAANNIGPLEGLLEIGDSVVGRAELGEAVEVVLARGSSTTVEVHAAQVESLTSAGSAAVGVRVIRDGRVGFAASGSHDADVVAETLAEARDNCRFAEPDEHNGLADPDGVEIVRQDLWYDEVISLPTSRRIELALELERMVVGSDGRVGFAASGSHDADVLAETLAEARDNCRFAEPDEHNGLADPDGVEIVHQDLWYDEVIALPTSRRIELALELERMVVGSDDRVTSARSTTYGDGWSQSALISTAGLRVASEMTETSVSTQPLARSGSETQIGWAFDAGRDPEALDLERVAREAVERATKLLGAGRPSSAKMTILLDPRLSSTLLAMVAGMLSGDAVAKGRSPFADRLGEVVASPLVGLVDDPTRVESMGAEEFDGEGLACRPNALITGGVLERFLHDSTSAKRLGVESTASAVRSVRGLPSPGPQLLVMAAGTTPSDALIGDIDLGLAVESFSGVHSGVNPVSGDFSVGANGLMIRDGELAEPVQELTVASTLQRLLMDISAVGDDFEWLPSGPGGASMRIDGVAVSGS